MAPITRGAVLFNPIRNRRCISLLTDSLKGGPLVVPEDSSEAAAALIPRVKCNLLDGQCIGSQQASRMPHADTSQDGHRRFTKRGGESRHQRRADQPYRSAQGLNTEVRPSRDVMPFRQTRALSAGHSNAKSAPPRVCRSQIATKQGQQYELEQRRRHWVPADLARGKFNHRIAHEPVELIIRIKGFDYRRSERSKEI